MNLYQRLMADGSDLSKEAAAALMQQAEELQYATAQIEGYKYKLSTLREYVDDLERRVRHGNRATNGFE